MEKLELAKEELNALTRMIEELLGSNRSLALVSGHSIGTFIRIYEFLERWEKLGEIWESLGLLKFYAPELVRAAEFYEKAGMLEKALELYKKGAEKCMPDRVMVYDENTGGGVSAMSYLGNENLLEEAEKLVGKCERKIKELNSRLEKEVRP